MAPHDGGYDRSPLLAELYDQVPAYGDRRDLDFLLEAAGRAGGPILELGCGTGRILIPLAQAGHRITGLDRSPSMLERCRNKLLQQPREVQQRARLVQADMTDFQLPDRFHLITAPFRPFQHLLSLAEQLACLDCVRRHLAPGGRLILDFFQTDPRRMHDPAFLVEQETMPERELADGRRLRRTERAVAYHRAEQINDVEIIYHLTHPDGRRERAVQAFPFRYFFRYEVEHLLARCGFELEALYGDFDGAALEDNSPEMIFVARVDRQIG